MTITAKFASQCGRCRQPIQVGDQIDWERGQKATHLKCPAATQPAQQPARIAVEDQGVYVLADGAIVRVKANREKTRTYAKRWTVINGSRLNENDARVHGEYVFEPGLVDQVAREGRKMTLDEAKAFILRYGLCARCSRVLKAAESVERGIGPVCVKYFTSDAVREVLPGAVTLVDVAGASTAPRQRRSYDELFGVDCRQCAPFPCDDPDRHLGVPSQYTPLANRGCHCGADFDGRDCMCFEN